MRKRLKEYLVPFGCGLLIALAVFLFSDKSMERGVIHRLCDAFFVPAVFLLGAGGLAFANLHGLFDVFSYGIRKLADTAWPWVGFLKEEDRNGNYADYRLRRQKKRRFPRVPLLSGATFLALAIFFLVVYFLL